MKHHMKRLAWLTLVLTLLIPAAGAFGAVDLTRPPFNKIEKFLQLRDKLASAADKNSWIPFVGNEKKDIQKDIDVYLDNALKVLLDDSIIKAKNDIKNLQDKNKKINDQISDYELLKATAPKQTKAYQVWKTTYGDLEEKIEKSYQEIENNKVKITRLMTEIKSKLAVAQIILSDDQINNIFIIKSGEDQLYSIVVIKNLYSLTDILQDLLKNSKNLTVSRKYYGIFLLATEAHQHQLLANLNSINNDYLPKLESIRKENADLMVKTRELAKNNSQYLNNLSAQQITDDVTKKFKELLISQRDLLLERLKTIDEIITYTDNTYKTVSLASSLSDSMDECVNNLAAMLKMPIVPPLAFDNQLEAKFLEISEQLSAAE